MTDGVELRLPDVTGTEALFELIERMPAHFAKTVAKIERDHESGCWLWMGARGRAGYGHLVLDGRTKQAHRAVYEMFGGEIPEGLYLDHLCRVRHCVNPAHMDPVTPSENTLRGLRRMFCVWGHRYTTQTAYYNEKGHRSCRICRARAAAEYRDRKAMA